MPIYDDLKEGGWQIIWHMQGDHGLDPLNQRETLGVKIRKIEDGEYVFRGAFAWWGEDISEIMTGDARRNLVRILQYLAMKGDHLHPAFSPDGYRVFEQDGRPFIEYRDYALLTAQGADIKVVRYYAN